MSLEHLARKQGSAPKLTGSSQKFTDQLEGTPLARCESMSLKSITTAIYYQSIEYIFRIHKFKVIIKIKGGGRDFFFFLEERPAINVNGRIELENHHVQSLVI